MREIMAEKAGKPERPSEYPLTGNLSKRSGPCNPDSLYTSSAIYNNPMPPRSCQTLLWAVLPPS